MGETRAVLGFRPHTYWTAVAAVAEGPTVLARWKVTFAEVEHRFVYHQAAEGDRADAAALIERTRGALIAGAAEQVRLLLDELKAEGVRVDAAATAASIAKLPERLEDILGTHARLHAAEGSLSRDVIAAACAAEGLSVRRVVEKEVGDLVGDATGLGPAGVKAKLQALGAALGPPWNEDFRIAVQAAWLRLEEGR